MDDKKLIIGPLSFSKIEEKASIVENISCLFCSKYWEFPKDKDSYLAHLYLIHRLIISDVADIPDLPAYLKFWYPLFQGHDVAEYCSTILMDQLPDGTKSSAEKYYLLSDVDSNDNYIRRKIKSDVLEKVLTQHQLERTNQSYGRECLYCREVVTPSQHAFIEHLYEKHFLQLGRPENLVYIDELIDVIQNKLETCTCLFCEKVFKDRPTLKEHMRKKGHKRINPDNKIYDKYFLVNYKTNDLVTSAPKTESERSQEKSEEANENSDSDWSDWDGEEQLITCLFCLKENPVLDNIKQHMIEQHNFDFNQIVSQLNFYQKIKVVNYIRRQIITLRCIVCNTQFGSKQKLDDHLREQKHYKLDDRKLWDKPEFFFPTYEDDPFLCLIEEGTDAVDDEESVVVAEDPVIDVTNESKLLVMQNLEIN